MISLVAIKNTSSSLTELAATLCSGCTLGQGKFLLSFALVFTAAYFVFTFVYFRHRWSLMGNATDRIPAALLDRKESKLTTTLFGRSSLRDSPIRDRTAASRSMDVLGRGPSRTPRHRT
jgi:hypothetical protein